MRFMQDHSLLFRFTRGGYQPVKKGIARKKPKRTAEIIMGYRKFEGQNNNKNHSPCPGLN
jgi:hypothetical protein